MTLEPPLHISPGLAHENARQKMLDVSLSSNNSSTYVIKGHTQSDNSILFGFAYCLPKLKHVGELGAGPTTVVCLPPSLCREVTLLRADLEAAPPCRHNCRTTTQASLKELMPNDTRRKNCSSFELLIQSCYYRVKNGVKVYCN
ncbi:hypothetical protein VPH35_110956 [Triticum aestivum]